METLLLKHTKLRTLKFILKGLAFRLIMQQMDLMLPVVYLNLLYILTYFNKFKRLDHGEKN